MKVAITGGCGFIGSHLARRGVGRGWEVVIFDDFSRFGPDNLGSIAKSVTTVQGRVENMGNLGRALGGVDVVFHLGGISRAVGSVENPQPLFETNVLGTHNVFETCRGTPTRVVFASSWVVYDRESRRPDVKAREGDRLGPETPYGLSKLIGEQYGKLYNDLYREDIVCLRLSNVYGPGDRNRVIPTMTSLAMKGDTIRVDGNPRFMNFVYVEDVVDALVSIAERKEIESRTYNIGTPDSVNLVDLATMIIKECNSSSSLRIGALPPHEYEYYCPDTSLARDELGFVAETSLERGIHECVQRVLRDRRELSFKPAEFVESRI